MRPFNHSLRTDVMVGSGCVVTMRMCSRRKQTDWQEAAAEEGTNLLFPFCCLAPEQSAMEIGLSKISCYLGTFAEVFI